MESENTPSPAIEQLVPPGAELIELATGMLWAEGPVYLPDEDALVWSDVRSNAVLQWSGKDGSVRDLYRPSDHANGHTLDRDGRVLACEQGTRRIARYEADGSRTTVVDRFEGKRFNSPNDLVVASDGAIWFSDPPYGLLKPDEGGPGDPELGHNYVFRFDRVTGEPAIVTDVMIDPNGLAFSPDESILYISDTSRDRLPDGHHHIMAFDVVYGRMLAAPRVFAVIEEGLADGLRVDVEGNVWTSAGTGISIFSPDGAELGRIPVPEPVGNCTFGGADGRRLFITASSTVWAIDVGVRGAVTPWVDR
jgi:gluconolactonase